MARRKKLLQNIADIRAMFCLIAANLHCIKKFIMDSPDRFLEGQKSKMEYPVLILEKPTKKPIPGGNQVEWSGAFVVLFYVSRRDEGYGSEDDAYEFTDEITDEIQRYINYGIEDANHERPCTEIFTFGTKTIVCDLECGYGWRVPFSFKTTLPKCANIWNWIIDKCPNLCPEFCWEAKYKPVEFIDEKKTTTELMESLQLENKTTGAEEIEWTIKRCRKVVHESKDTKLDLPGSLFYDEEEGCDVPLEVILKVCTKDEEGEQCCKYARILVHPCEGCGKSHPWHPIDCTDDDVSINPGGE